MTDRKSAFLKEAAALLADAEVLRRKIAALREEHKAKKFDYSLPEKIQHLEDWRLELVAKAHSLQKMAEETRRK